MVGKPLDCRDGDNVDLLVLIEINDGLMLLIKGFEQESYLEVKIVHP